MRPRNAVKFLSAFKSPPRKYWFPAAACLSILCLCAGGMSSTESAIANGDTRIIRLHHAHTGESIEIAFRVNGYYDPAALEKLNWFLRDWRRDEATKMDPRLFDAVWESYRAAGATDPIVVVCGYRSPETNAMLRTRSRAVAEHSQHILGKAMDTTMPGMSMEKVREVAMRLQLGGVGYYGNANFVHIDVGGVRSWPRMSYDQLARLFPDGKTVHVASDGRTLARYEEARAELQSRGDVDVPPSSQGGNFFAWLFNLGHGEDEREETAADQTTPPVRTATRARPSDDGRPMAAPVAQTDKTVVASLPPRGVHQPADQDVALVTAPLPPSRPQALAALAGTPVPPTLQGAAVPTMRDGLTRTAANEPAAATRKDQIGNLIATTGAVTARVGNLPDLITRGSTAPAAPLPTPTVLAYAGNAKLDGLRTAAHNRKANLPVHTALLAQAPVPMVRARLDQTNFLMMTSSVELARVASPTVFGSSIAGLRQLARDKVLLAAGSLSNVVVAAAPTRFRVAATDLPTGHFADAAGTAYAARDHGPLGPLALRTED